MDKPKMVFDKDNLMNRLEGDMELARDLVILFLEDVEERKTALAKAIENKNLSGIEIEAHSLKGAAANLSVNVLERTAYRIEMAGKQKDLATAENTFDDLTSAIEEAAAVLEAEFLS